MWSPNEGSSRRGVSPIQTATAQKHKRVANGRRNPKTNNKPEKKKKDRHSKHAFITRN